MADETASILCFGAMHMDKLARCHREFMPGVSNPVSSSFAVGGVGFNIARNIRLRGVDVGMVSITGDDPDGRYVKEIAKEYGIDASNAFTSETMSTATYTAILSQSGELAAGLSEMDIYENLSVDKLKGSLKDFHGWKSWIIDANLPADSIAWLCQNKGDSIVYAAPVSVVKAERWASAVKDADIWIGNGTEATVLSGVLVNGPESARIAAAKLRNMGPKIVVITMAADGVVVDSGDVQGHWFIPPTKVRDVNGAGDSFFAGFAAKYSQTQNVVEAVETGICVASLTTENDGPVCANLSDQMIDERRALLPKPEMFLPVSA